MIVEIDETLPANLGSARGMGSVELKPIGGGKYEVKDHHPTRTKEELIELLTKCPDVKGIS